MEKEASQEHIAVPISVINDNEASPDSSGLIHPRISVVSGSGSSMNEKHWTTLKTLIDKASAINERQTEILARCLEKRETAVLSALRSAGENFSKFLGLMELGVEDFFDILSNMQRQPEPKFNLKHGGYKEIQSPPYPVECRRLIIC